MSNFSRIAIHPDTGKEEMASFIDNHYGWHLYGVQFSDGKVFPESSVVIPRIETVEHDVQSVSGEVSGEELNNIKRSEGDYHPYGFTKGWWNGFIWWLGVNGYKIIRIKEQNSVAKPEKIL